MQEEAVDLHESSAKEATALADRERIAQLNLSKVEEALVSLQKSHKDELDAECSRINLEMQKRAEEHNKRSMADHGKIQVRSHLLILAWIQALSRSWKRR